MGTSATDPILTPSVDDAPTAETITATDRFAQAREAAATPQVPGSRDADQEKKHLEELLGQTGEEIDAMGVAAPGDSRGILPRTQALNEVMASAATIEDKLRFLAEVNRSFGRDTYKQVYLEPLSYEPNEVMLLQRRLTLGGYLSEGANFKSGAYDKATRKAVEDLILDARLSKKHPTAVLNERVSLTTGNPVKAWSDKGWEEAQTQAYMKVHGMAPPPHYFEDKRFMNPQEIETYERGKATYKNSSTKSAAEQALMNKFKSVMG